MTSFKGRSQIGLSPPPFVVFDLERWKLRITCFYIVSSLLKGGAFFLIFLGWFVVSPRRLTIGWWMMVFDGGSFCGRGKILWRCATRALLWWCLWKERNAGCLKISLPLLILFGLLFSIHPLSCVQIPQIYFVIIAFLWLLTIGGLFLFSFVGEGFLNPLPLGCSFGSFDNVILGFFFFF